ncbi:MAG: helix-turn-helix domain-containing protein [Gammaproteobacteria bacterium]|nr:helix-turn-helix domain-containing protein [Gammaproteobacteria bacterium]
MSYALIKEKAHELFEQAHFITHIDNEEDYTEALALMDELIEDYDHNKPLIEVLSLSIEKWEDQAEYFSEFNKDIESLDNDTSLLKVLMSQHHLKGEDLKNEIGSKSLVSMILNGKRKLTIEHIQALSNRFNISPSLFFS